MQRPILALYFIFLAAVWGASFMFMRVGVPEFGVYAFGGLRVGIAGLVLLPLLFTAKRWAEFKANWLRLSLIGIVSAGLPFMLYAFAAKTLNAGVSSVINASVPIMTGFIAHVFFHDRISKQQLLGLVVGVVGVAFLMLDTLSQGVSSPLPFLGALAACLCYAIGSNLTKRYLPHVSPMTTAASGLLASGVVTLPFVVYYFPSQPVSLHAWAATIAIAVVSTAVAMIIFYDLIKKVGPTKTVTVTLLIPVFGIFWGMLLLRETLTLQMLIGTVIILIGTALSVIKLKKQ